MLKVTTKLLEAALAVRAIWRPYHLESHSSVSARLNFKFWLKCPNTGPCRWIRRAAESEIIFNLRLDRAAKTESRIDTTLPGLSLAQA